MGCAVDVFCFFPLPVLNVFGLAHVPKLCFKQFISVGYLIFCLVYFGF